MGAFDDVAAITIPVNAEQCKEWGWEPHEQVILKGVMDVSDQEFIANKYGSVTKKGDVEMQSGTGKYSVLQRMILSWTFMKDGQTVPLTIGNIRRLPTKYSIPILEACDRIADPMGEEAQQAFLIGANGRTPEHSDLAKAHHPK